VRECHLRGDESFVTFVDRINLWEQFEAVYVEAIVFESFDVGAKRCLSLVGRAIEIRSFDDTDRL
jgi:hypothetical protein